MKRDFFRGAGSWGVRDCRPVRGATDAPDRGADRPRPLRGRTDYNADHMAAARRSRRLLAGEALPRLGPGSGARVN